MPAVRRPGDVSAAAARLAHRARPPTGHASSAGGVLPSRARSRSAAGPGREAGAPTAPRFRRPRSPAPRGSGGCSRWSRARPASWGGRPRRTSAEGRRPYLRGPELSVSRCRAARTEWRPTRSVTTLGPMPTKRAVIVLEFNELSPDLMQRFIDAGHLPAFRRLRDEAEVWSTDAGERPPFLEPWIQWITVHSGERYAEHGVFNLDEGHRAPAPRIWDLLSAAGLDSWICGSMNVAAAPGFRGWLLPDPWTTQVPPRPAALLPYFDFVRRHVLEYTNEQVPVTNADRVRFVAFMARHGLSAATAWAIVRQLAGERLDPSSRWRRAVLLDRLQFDLFRWHWRRARPAFSTFFLNSTAHFQHFYWRNLEPERFAVRPDADEQRAHADAVLFGYRQMDRLVAETLAMAGNDATVVLCTALSQQPCLTYEESGGKVIYRPRDFERLLAFAGVTAPHRVAPVMAEEFHVYLER